MKILRTWITFACLLGLMLPGGVKSQDVMSRRVRGTVYNSQNRPISSAIVYLQNLRTHRIRTYISNRKGHYQFSGLKAYDDYEVHAEFNGLSSDTETIVRTDGSGDLVINLTVDKRR